MEASGFGGRWTCAFRRLTEGFTSGGGKVSGCFRFLRSTGVGTKLLCWRLCGCVGASVLRGTARNGRTCSNDNSFTVNAP